MSPINRLKDALPAWFQRTPAGKDAIAELEGELATEREVHAAAIVDAQNHRAKEYPALDAALDKAEASVDKARATLKRAEAAARDAYVDRARLMSRTENTVNQHKLALRKTADPTIDPVLRKVRELIFRERKNGVMVEFENTGKYAPHTRNDPWVRIKSNKAAIHARHQGILAAIQAIEVLRFSPKADVVDDIKAILAGIPRGDVLEIVGEGAVSSLRPGTVAEFDGFDTPDWHAVLSPGGSADASEQNTQGGGIHGPVVNGMPIA